MFNVSMSHVFSFFFFFFFFVFLGENAIVSGLMYIKSSAEFSFYNPRLNGAFVLFRAAYSLILLPNYLRP